VLWVHTSRSLVLKACRRVAGAGAACVPMERISQLSQRAGFLEYRGMVPMSDLVNPSDDGAYKEHKRWSHWVPATELMPQLT